MLEAIKNLVWSPFTISALVFVGLIILVKSRFYAVLRFPYILKDAISSIRSNRRAFSLMCTSLGGTIGVGNAIGVAGAVLEGGPGAVFWMAVAGFLGMSIKHCEIYFSVKLKKLSEFSPGPIAYIKKSFFGRELSFLYAILCILVSLGMGNLSQTKSAVSSLEGIINLPPSLIASLFALLFIIIARGGLKKISGFSEKIIPLISFAYVLFLLTIIFRHKSAVNDSIHLILSQSGIFYGAKWALVKRGMTNGFSKSIFSSEAGLGSAGFAHGETELSAEDQAKWGVFEVFVDSLICILTGLCLVLTWDKIGDLPFGYMSRGLFRYALGNIGEVFFGVSMFIFSFSSVICWYYNGSVCIRYLSKGEKLQFSYFFLFAIFTVLSAFISAENIILVSDIANGLMMLLNVFCLCFTCFKNSLTF